MPEAILEANSVSKTYGVGPGRVVALDAATVSANRGEVLLIMGPSGSGKTTLLSIMGCILQPSDGQVMVNGQVVTGLGENALPDIRRQHLGFVFQSFNLFRSLTAHENVEVVLRMKGTVTSESRAHCLALLERVGLGHRAHAYPGEMSGGEKQRTALARALVGDPPIILADEPTANLDSLTGRDVLQLLRELAEREGKAVVIVSHDAKAEEVAHRVVFMLDGRLQS